MERLTREEVRKLTDKEVRIAYRRITRDYSYGLLNDKVTPLQNRTLLAEELHKRGLPEHN